MNDFTGWLPDWLYVDGEFVSGLALVCDARGNVARFSREPADLARCERLPNQALVPGLVNAHSHAFQRMIRGRVERPSLVDVRDTFWTWREGMYRAALMLDAVGAYDVARMAFLEMLGCGVTAVGEFHYLHNASDGRAYPGDPHRLARETIRAARDVGLRITLLRTAYQRGGPGRELQGGQVRFRTGPADEFLRETVALRDEFSAEVAAGEINVGVAPHSIRAVDLRTMSELILGARALGMPAHLHAAEQPAEIAMCVAENGAPPVRLLAREKLLGPDVTLVHAIHVEPDEIEAVGAAGATVCACPSTERNLGDGVLPADGYLRAGARIALGSDSQTQSELLEDARQLEFHLRLRQLRRLALPGAEVTRKREENSNADAALARQLLRCATESGARSLALPGGALHVGGPADFFTVDLRDPALAGSDESPDAVLNAVVWGTTRAAIRNVCVGGRLLVRDGQHADSAEIIERFRALQAQLWESRRR